MKFSKLTKQAAAVKEDKNKKEFSFHFINLDQRIDSPGSDNKFILMPEISPLFNNGYFNYSKLRSPCCAGCLNSCKINTALNISHIPHSFIIHPSLCFVIKFCNIITGKIEYFNIY